MLKHCPRPHSKNRPSPQQHLLEEDFALEEEIGVSKVVVLCSAETAWEWCSAKK